VADWVEGRKGETPVEWDRKGEVGRSKKSLIAWEGRKKGGHDE